MKIHPIIISALLTAAILLEAWTLRSVNELQVNVATIKQQLNDLCGKPASIAQNPTQ